MVLTFRYWGLFLTTILPAFLTSAGQLAVHDETFQPDFILRITEEDVPFACEGTRKSVLVNGTSPGPELRLKPNSTTWVRVYNDMDHLNTTIVRDYQRVIRQNTILTILSIGMVWRNE